MTDHAEEQQMEAEALTAIFESFFTIVQSDPSSPIQWSISIYPETGNDPSELDMLNHVACHLHVTLPLHYPECIPEIRIEIIKGLSDDHRDEIQQFAIVEAQSNIGQPSIFAITERIRDWLRENNIKGLDDISMHAQMMRKKREEEKTQQRLQESFEAQKKQEEMTDAEKEDLEIRKRRAEGTPCNKENFEAWKKRFELEMATTTKNKQSSSTDNNNDTTEDGIIKKKKETNHNKEKEVDKTGRITGYEYFSSKTVNLEALEAAAEAAETDELGMEELNEVDEDLFDEDVDMDELDYEDEEEEEEVDI